MHTLIQCLYILVFGNLNSQTTIGIGNSNSMYTATGTANAYGLCNEYSPNKTSNSYAIKCFGIEDLWGGEKTSSTTPLNTFLSGGHVYTSSGSSSSYAQVSLYTNPLVNVTERYVYSTRILSSSWLNAPLGKSLFGFLPSERTTPFGSAGTFFSDFVDLNAQYLCIGAGKKVASSTSGIFSLTSFSTGSGGVNNGFIGSRLMYMRERII